MHTLEFFGIILCHLAIGVMCHSKCYCGNWARFAVVLLNSWTVWGQNSENSNNRKPHNFINLFVVFVKSLNLPQPRNIALRQFQLSVCLPYTFFLPTVLVMFIKLKNGWHQHIRDFRRLGGHRYGRKILVD